MHKPSLAVDIDDVLTPTSTEVRQETGGDEDRIALLLNNPKFLLALPLNTQAAKILKVSRTVTVGCYITSRLHQFHQVTQAWLDKHHLPASPLVTRHTSWQQTNWKINYLLDQGIRVAGLIDDNWQAFVDTARFTGYKLWFNPRRLTRPEGLYDLMEVWAWNQVPERMLVRG